MDHALEFIETPLFTRQIRKIATDDELKDLQKELIQYPTKGDVMPQTGGLRKIRMRIDDKGKSGGARVIYFLVNLDIVWLVLAYPKSAKDSLTEAEKAALRKLTATLKEES